MRYNFETENLDTRVYKRMIRSYIASQYSRFGRLKFMMKNILFPITIRPSSAASEDPFFHGKDGIGGNTAPNKMVLYLTDQRENPNDVLQKVIRSNLIVITHEFGHKFLMDAGRSEKVPLRNDDEMGHKAGTKLNFWTAEVHDRDIENVSYSKEFIIYDNVIDKQYKSRFKVLDFRDLLN